MCEPITLPKHNFEFQTFFFAFKNSCMFFSLSLFLESTTLILTTFFLQSPLRVHDLDGFDRGIGYYYRCESNTLFIPVPWLSWSKVNVPFSYYFPFAGMGDTPLIYSFFLKSRPIHSQCPDNLC